LKVALALLLALIGGGMAWIRLAPSDPLVWNADPVFAPGLPEGTVIVKAGGARVVIRLTDTTPAAALARLDAIALDTPRTRRLAGTPEDGRMTWLTRSAVFGFPDYTTAEARQDGTATLLALHARLRFGGGDFGVNAARLRAWIAKLAP